MSEAEIAMRNDFQSKVPAKVIAEIEQKFLDFSKRSRNESPAECLTLDERNVYADYLASKGQFQGAEHFRQYASPIDRKTRPETKGKVKDTRIEIELINFGGVCEAKMLVEKGTVQYALGDRLFFPTNKKEKNKFYESAIKMTK